MGDDSDEERGGAALVRERKETREREERQGRPGGEGVTGNRGLGKTAFPCRPATGRAGAWPSSPHAWTARQQRKQ
jgi:hypothetical protein